VANPTTLSQTGVGRSTVWMPDWNENPFNIGIGVIVVGTATYNIEHTFQDPTALQRQALLASTTTLLTFDPAAFAAVYGKLFVGFPVTDVTTPAGIVAGRTVSSFGSNTVTMSGVAAGVLAGDLISFLTWFPNSGLNAQTANANGNYAFPVRGISINVTAGTGTVIADFIQATTPQS
jgi:hypothetical protein